ncbi:MAG: hypothetical protein QNJ31_06245 [Candidatus Caenarcaniphilales bacterium]|nr:hypothetical protein [Candidatus Caenarcaniphilales bacterium]
MSRSRISVLNVFKSSIDSEDIDPSISVYANVDKLMLSNYTNYILLWESESTKVNKQNQGKPA